MIGLFQPDSRRPEPGKAERPAFLDGGLQDQSRSQAEDGQAVVSGGDVDKIAHRMEAMRRHPGRMMADEYGLAGITKIEDLQPSPLTQA